MSLNLVSCEIFLGCTLINLISRIYYQIIKYHLNEENQEREISK